MTGKNKNRIKSSWRSKLFSLINGIVLTLLALLCILPLVNVLAISLSSNTAVTAGKVMFLPVDFTLKSYEYVAKREAFWRAMGITLERCLLGVALNVLLCIMTAYPLSMLINGGLIPNFMTVKSLNLLGTIWALVLPGAVPVFSVVLMLNFFRALPDELEEAAIVDGANQWQIMMKIYVPLSKASIATIFLFALVYHWNAWFDGIIYMNKPEQYPLQSYLNTILVDTQSTTSGALDWQTMSLVSDRTVKCAQIFLSTLPIIAAYPYLQKYFVKGMVLGSVKG